MERTQSARRTVLTIGIAGAFMLAAQGAAMAGHGYKMEQHPHRDGSSPVSGEAAASTDTSGGADAQAVAEARPGDWKRGDPPRAARVRADRDLVGAQ